MCKDGRTEEMGAAEIQGMVCSGERPDFGGKGERHLVSEEGVQLIGHLLPQRPIQSEGAQLKNRYAPRPLLRSSEVCRLRSEVVV